MKKFIKHVFGEPEPEYIHRWKRGSDGKLYEIFAERHTCTLCGKSLYLDAWQIKKGLPKEMRYCK